MSTEKNRCNCECSATYESLVLLLDDAECSSVKRAQLRARIEQCPECFERLGLEEEVRALLRSCCGAKAPRKLYERVSISIRVQRNG